MLRLYSILMVLCAFSPLAYAVEPVADPQSDNTASADEKLTDELIQERFEQTTLPLLEQYCFDCHSGSEPEAGVDLSMFSTVESVRKAPAVWNQVRGLVKLGAMPPPEDFGEMPADEIATLDGWIDDALNYVDCSTCNAVPPTTVQRLNSVQYDHVVRDVFGADLKPSRSIGFVTDEVGNGFDNQGEVLTLNPLAIEKYLLAAKWVAEQAITVDEESLRKQSYGGGAVERGETFRTRLDLARGRYTIRTRMVYGFNLDEGEIDVSVKMDGREIERVIVPHNNERFTFDVFVDEGEHDFEIKLIANDKIGDRGGYRYRLRVDGLMVEGPEKGRPRFPLSHRRVVVAEPGPETTTDEAAETIARNLLRGLLRGQENEEAIAAVTRQIVEGAEAEKNFFVGVRRGIELALVLPEFLFRLEGAADPQAVADDADLQPIDDRALASRLSFFLWSSIPDETLLKLAEQGTLHEPDVLRQQIDRMIDDPKIQAGLISQFFGQWLGLRNLTSIELDPKQFPMHNPKLVEAMIRETEMVCLDVLRQGQLNDMLSLDYSYRNPRLAELYGDRFDGEDAGEMYLARRQRNDDGTRTGDYKREDDYVKTPLPAERRGLLTHASVLTLTSNPTRTSPVKRGKWVLDNILGDPPPAAPPGVPALEDAGEDTKKLSLRQQLEIHRANPSCASCHKIMDPIGLGLENFDAIGRYREEDHGVPIDSAGELADGRKFSGSAELLPLLMSDEEKFAKHFVSKLLTFALGRGLVRQDNCTLEAILNATRSDGYELRDLVYEVAASRPFRMQSVD